jgi:hypothetical protein
MRIMHSDHDGHALRETETGRAHADMPGVAIAAAVTSSNSSGNATHCPRLATVLSDMPPSGDLGRTKYTRRPSSRRPSPSIPTTNGKSPEVQ